MPQFKVIGRARHTLHQGYSTNVSKGPDKANEKSFGPEKVLTVIC